MTRRRFRREDGYNEGDLLFAGLDHIKSAILLLNHGPYCLDSAGYLAQLGVELILKAVLLSRIDFFLDEHRLSSLLEEAMDAGAAVHLEADQIAAIDRLDSFFQLRYPTGDRQMSLSTEDFRPIPQLLTALLGGLSPELQALAAAWQQPEPDGTYRKHGRVAMFKPSEGRG